MISTIVPKEKQPKKPEYPCLKQGKTRKLVIFFIGAKIGIVLYAGKDVPYEFGYYNTAWDMSYFTPFEGELLLKND